MASKLGFRQHLLLLLFLDIFIILFIGLGSNSFLADFISDPLSLSLTSTTGIGLIIVTLFIGISSIGVTSGSNFAGISGIIASALGKTIGGVAVMGTVLAVIVDYILIYNLIISGANDPWSGGWIKLIAIVIFIPLIVDALFASMDWARGVNT